MNLRNVLLIVLLILPFVVRSEDNITIINTVYTPMKSYDIQMPIMMSKTNLQGKSFDNKDLLKTFVSFPQKSEYSEQLKANIYDYFQLSKPVN